MVAHATRAREAEPIHRRVLIFTVKDYALIGPGGPAANCWAWTSQKFLAWLRDGVMVPILGDDGQPIFFPERTEPWAIENGCYWFRCQTMAGNLPLYALIPWPFAQEIGRLFDIELTKPSPTDEA